MATAPFGAVLETALKEDIQNAKMTACSGLVVHPRFFCCISGNTVGVAKDPVAVVVADAEAVCIGVVFDVDYSRSWSPTSTINAWSVDWGDGNISNGAWPGAGSVAHPLGGYVLPGTYTITLTVTDLLGATGVDTVQVVALDCAVFPLAAYVSCGSSGVWFTRDAGHNWEERGGGVLDGVMIHDLKVSPFTFATGSVADGTFDTSSINLWAATENGLYRSADGGMTWGLIPLEAGYIPYSVLPSLYSPTEVYTLAYNAITGNVALFRSEDDGLTWASLSMSGALVIPGKRCTDAPNHLDRGHKMSMMEFGDGIFSVDDDDRGTRYYDPGAGTCADYGGDLNDNMAVHTFDSFGTLLRVTCGEGGALYDFGGGWTRFLDIGAADLLPGSYVDVHMAIAGGSGVYFVLSATDVTAVERPAFDWQLVPNSPWALPVGNGRFLHVFTNYWTETRMFWVATNNNRILRCDIDGAGGDAWVVEWIGGSDIIAPFAEGRIGADLHILATTGATRLLILNTDDLLAGWTWDTIVCPEAITCVAGRDYRPSGSRPYVGTASGIYYRDSDIGEYVKISDLSNVKRLYFSERPWPVLIQHLYALTDGVDAGIYEVGVKGAPSLHDDGWHYSLAMSPDGLYIYIALIAGGVPTFYRVPYDLASLGELPSVGGTGWGGVVTDFNRSKYLWAFGDFGDGDKVRLSEDYGDTLTNVTDGTWANNEVVRPLLPSVYSPGDVVAILNIALETWQSRDTGGAWGQIGAAAVPFAAQCGARDFVDDQIVFIGASVQNVDNLQGSPNIGYQWLNRSLPINAGITSVIIVG